MPTQWIMDAWAEIHATGEDLPGGWRAKRLPLMADGRPLALAVDDMGEHHLLVPKGSDPLPTNANSPLSVAIRDFSFRGASGVEIQGSHLDIHCRVTRLNGQFDKVILDVIEVVLDAKSAANAAAAAVADWRRLFTRLAELQSLNYQQRIAVFGELSVLRDVIEFRPDFQPEWWTGPHRDPHDFELPDMSLEVKSIGEDSTSVTVHGFEQLERVDGKPLHFVVRKVVEQADGMTLAELLGDILRLVRGATEVRDRAAALGVFDSDPDPLRFAVVETLAGEVAGDFPRIAWADLNHTAQQAVSRIAYDIELAVLRSSMAPHSIEDVVRTV